MLSRHLAPIVLLCLGVLVMAGVSGAQAPVLPDLQVDQIRLGLDGKPRQLHVDHALESIAFGTWGAPDWEAPKSGRPGISCDDFIMELIDLEDGEEASSEGSGPLILMGVGGEGELSVRAGKSVSSAHTGETRLVPAAIADEVKLEAEGRAKAIIVRIPTQ